MHESKILMLVEIFIWFSNYYHYIDQPIIRCTISPSSLTHFHHHNITIMSEYCHFTRLYMTRRTAWERKNGGVAYANAHTTGAFSQFLPGDPPQPSLNGSGFCMWKSVEHLCRHRTNSRSADCSLQRSPSLLHFRGWAGGGVGCAGAKALYAWSWSNLSPIWPSQWKVKTTMTFVIFVLI